MHTALFYYQYSDRTPLDWDIAIDRNASKSRFKLDYPYVKPYYMEKKHLEYGITEANFEGAIMKIFDWDRLICEIITPQRKYKGISFQIVGKIKNSRTPFNVDIGVGDIIVPKSEKRRIPVQLSEFMPPEICTYSLESTIAEKFDAILELVRFFILGLSMMNIISKVGDLDGNFI